MSHQDNLGQWVGGIRAAAGSARPSPASFSRRSRFREAEFVCRWSPASSSFTPISSADHHFSSLVHRRLSSGSYGWKQTRRRLGRRAHERRRLAFSGLTYSPTGDEGKGRRPREHETTKGRQQTGQGCRRNTGRFYDNLSMSLLFLFSTSCCRSRSITCIYEFVEFHCRLEAALSASCLSNHSWLRVLAKPNAPARRFRRVRSSAAPLNCREREEIAEQEMSREGNAAGQQREGEDEP